MKHLISMVVVLLALGGAALLNPSEDQHKDAIVAQYNAHNPISGALGVGRALAEATTYHNYVFFSQTTIGEEKMSTGYAGRVDARSIDVADLPEYVLELLPEDVQQQVRR